MRASRASTCARCTASPRSAGLMVAEQTRGLNGLWWCSGEPSGRGKRNGGDHHRAPGEIKVEGLLIKTNSLRGPEKGGFVSSQVVV